LAVVLYLAGAWAEIPDAANRLTATWEDLARSPLGSLLGLTSVKRGPVIEVTEAFLIARLELELAPFVRGLHTAVAADTWEILDLPRPSGVKSPVPPETAPNLPDGGGGGEGPQVDPVRKR
jgi:hypothetical protein